MITSMTGDNKNTSIWVNKVRKNNFQEDSQDGTRAFMAPT